MSSLRYFGATSHPPGSPPPPADDDEELVPLAGGAAGAGGGPNESTSRMRRFSMALQRGDGMRAFGTLREHVRGAVAGDAQALAASQEELATAVAATASTGAAGNTAGAGAGTANDLPTGDIAEVARWMEDAAPSLMLLFAVFLYRHLLGIITFGWLTSVLHGANERMRRQTMVKEHRSRAGLLMLSGLLFALLCFVSVVQAWDRVAHQPSARLLHQLQLRRVADFEAEPPPIAHLLWDVVVADLVARAALLLAKAQLALVCFYVLPHGGSAGAGRRLRRVFAFVEAAGLCYRVLLPAPLWFHFFFHAAESYPTDASVWAFGVSHFYLAIKLLSFCERLKKAVASAQAAVSLRLPVGTYATPEDIMELGDSDGCTICQEEHFTVPVRLECSHVFCEDCITSWCERTSNPTCPLCRAPVPAALALAHSDGSTPLLPQVF